MGLSLIALHLGSQAFGVVGLGMPSGFEWLIVLAIVGLAGVSSAKGAGGGPTLVLKEFTLSRSPAQGSYLHLSGRPQGILAFLLSILGLSPETSLDVKVDKVVRRSASLSGRHYDLAALASVASSHCGFVWNIALAVLSVVLIIGGVAAGLTTRDGMIIMAAGVVLGLIFATAFVLSKKMYIRIVTNGGTHLTVTFKQSVVENVRVDFAKVEEAIHLLNAVLAHARSPRVAQPAAATA